VLVVLPQGAGKGARARGENNALQSKREKFHVVFFHNHSLVFVAYCVFGWQWLAHCVVLHAAWGVQKHKTQKPKKYLSK
jgi:hypothetical protein